MKKFSVLCLAIFSAAIFLSACSQGIAVETGAKAPDFSLPDIEGRETSLSNYMGKVVILDFFASWCPPCREEVPDFIALQDTYGSRGFTMIGVSLVDKKASIEFSKKMGINYPVLVDSGNASNLYGPIRSIPTTFVLDKNHVIARVYIGYRPKEVFENDINELLTK